MLRLLNRVQKPSVFRTMQTSGFSFSSNYKPGDHDDIETKHDLANNNLAILKQNGDFLKEECEAFEAQLNEN